MATTKTVDELLRAADLAYREQRTRDAIQSCRDAIALAPRNPQAKFMLGALQAMEGDLEAALSTLREAAEIAPAFPEPNLHLLTLLRNAGRMPEAIAAGEQFVRAAPGATIGRTTLATCYFENGMFEEAIAQYRIAAALSPTDARLRTNLVRALEHVGKTKEAAKLLRQGAATPLSIAAAYELEGKPDQAIDAYRAALTERPQSYQARLGLGKALISLRRPAEAVDALQTALSIDPEGADACAALGHALQELGLFDESIAYLEKAISLEPRLMAPLLGIVLAKKIRPEDHPLLHRMEDLVNSQKLPPKDRSDLEYALGKAYDDLGNYETALAHFDQATEAAVKPFDKAASARGVEFTTNTFDHKFFQTHRSPITSELPILIVGVPRSGTTLLEQMLSNHLEIGAAGEQPFWIIHGEAAFQALKRGEQEIAEEYLRLLASLAPGKSRVTDKMPTNYTMLGVIHALLPNARIIHCRRHPVDTCLSLYMNAHSISEMPFGNRRQDLVDGYLDYLKVADHWRRTIPPDRFIDVHYEDLVENPATVLPSVIEFCRLNWDDACLRPQDNPRQVSTPSRWQVRQPVYKTSVARWQRYEPWLGEFRRLLDEVTERPETKRSAAEPPPSEPT